MFDGAAVPFPGKVPVLSLLAVVWYNMQSFALHIKNALPAYAVNSRWETAFFARARSCGAITQYGASHRPAVRKKLLRAYARNFLRKTSFSRLAGEFMAYYYKV